MNLEKILEDVIRQYGKNEGYALPTVKWSEENMISCFAEYRFWENKIVVSRLLNTDHVRERTIAALLFHEYTHQLYNKHNISFQMRMEQFEGYVDCLAELEDYFDGLEEFPATVKHNFPLDKNADTVLCYLPQDSHDLNYYWTQIKYIDHYLTGKLSKKISRKFCNKKIPQIIFLIKAEKVAYVAGWCKEGIIYRKNKVVNLSNLNQGKICYQFKYPVEEGRIIPPYGVFIGMSDDEIPYFLRRYGICSSSDVNEEVFDKLIKEANAYSFNFCDLGMYENMIDCIPGIEINDVPQLLRMARLKDNYGGRAIWILNKAVSLEESYRTYFARAKAFWEYNLFDRAIDDLNRALEYEEPKLKFMNKSQIRKTIKRLVRIKKAI